MVVVVVVVVAMHAGGDRVTKRHTARKIKMTFRIYLFIINIASMQYQGKRLFWYHPLAGAFPIRV